MCRGRWWCGQVPNVYLSEYHKYAFTAVWMTTIYVYYLACATPPGYITAENIDRYSRYDCDEKIFFANTICRTTGERPTTDRD